MLYFNKMTLSALGDCIIQKGLGSVRPTRGFDQSLTDFQFSEAMKRNYEIKKHPGSVVLLDRRLKM